MILIGQTHTMFNLHTDNVDSATWQTQIKGRKRWRVCPPSETPYLYENKEKRKTGSSDLNTFHVDEEKFPLWLQARCYDYVAVPGEQTPAPAPLRRPPGGPVADPEDGGDSGGGGWCSRIQNTRPTTGRCAG